MTLLALRLFDELQPLHGLGATERFWLHCAGLLHDIGWIEGRKGHHKTALRMILTTPDLPFERREREIIGCVARYHRRGLPTLKHEAFAALSAPDQRVVRRLAAILRVADGLDRTHQGIVKDVTCAIGRNRSASTASSRSPPRTSSAKRSRRAICSRKPSTESS